MKQALSIVFLALALCFCAEAHAEIEKNALSCDTGMCLYWWPKLGAVPGWHAEKDYSFHYGINALAPDGYDFSNADVVMYASAQYKPRLKDITTLEGFIDNDCKVFVLNNEGIKIAEAAALMDKDGQILRTFTFAPGPGKSNDWERVAYGEEGDFFLIFTVSAHSKQALEKAMKDYEAMVAAYAK